MAKAVTIVVLLVVAVAGLVVGVVDMVRHASLLAPAALGVGLVCSVTAYILCDHWERTLSPREWIAPVFKRL